jgi:nucleotide-binding universal stress UspA family protein
MPGSTSGVDGNAGSTSIVVGVDGSAHARLALKWAADEADRRGSGLTVLCARTHESRRTPAWYETGGSDLSPEAAIVEDAVALVATRCPSVVVQGEVVEWPAAMVLTAASRTAELLVVGARGLGGFDELLLGSVSDQCVQYAHGPVVVVHADGSDIPYRASGSRIVVGIDGSLGSSRALQWALDEARVRSVSVDAVCAWQSPPVGAFTRGPASGAEVVARDVVDAVIERAERLAPDVPFRATAVCDAPVPGLLGASRGAALLVVGARGHARFRDALLGSVAHQCARHARCAVVVSRPPVGGAGRVPSVRSVPTGAIG